MITDNEELRPKLTELMNTTLKMCYPIYRRRLTCAEILTEYNQWGIKGDQIQVSLNFEEQLNQVENSNDTFFNNYLIIKLKQC